MSIVNAFLFSSVCLLTNDYPGLCTCFAGPYALVPRVLKSCVTSSTSAVSEPGTAVTTTTYFPRFSDGAAFGAYGTDGRRRSFCWVFYAGIDQTQKERKRDNSHRAMIYCITT